MNPELDCLSKNFDVIAESISNAFKDSMRGSEPESRGPHKPESWVQLLAPLPELNVLFWEHRSTNSAEYIVAHLTCGHERTFNGNRPVGKGWVRCWECDRIAAALKSKNSYADTTKVAVATPGDQGRASRVDGPDPLAPHLEAYDTFLMNSFGRCNEYE